MNIETQGKWVVALAAVGGLVVAGSGTAYADEGAKAASAGASAEADKPEGEEKGEKHEEKEEEAVKVALDVVFGWGKVPFAVQNQTGTGPNPQTPTYSATDKTASNVQSSILGAAVEVVEHFEVGLRVPLTFSTFNPDGASSRSTSAVGNLEFEGEYEGRVAKGLHLVGALGVALPTAPGTEIDPALSNATNVDQSGFDRFSLSKAAAAARGYEDNALFEPNRWGIIPKIGLLYRTHGLSVEPYLKLENLIAKSGDMPNSYVGELVGGLRVGYWIQKEFEVAVRAWFNTTYAGADEDKKTSAALEPQLVLRFGPVRPYAGFIIPVAGPPNENGFLGLRVGLAAAF
jgi:hypothetical protein